MLITLKDGKPKLRKRISVFIQYEVFILQIILNKLISVTEQDIFKNESQGIQKIKSQSTNRINLTCTLSMILIEDTDSNHIKVVYCKTHFSHGFNLVRCHLSKNDRTMIARKIAEGLTH